LELPSRLGMKDASRITPGRTTDFKIKTYIMKENIFVLNSAWNKDLLCKLIFRLKSMEFGIYSLGFDPKEKANNTVGRYINHPELGESSAEDVEMIACPECGKFLPG
jgi:hypothetical protein